MRAVFRDLVRSENGTEELRLEYADETRVNLDAIVRARIALLIGRYCGDTTNQLKLFGEEYAPVFGANDTADAHEISYRIFVVFEGARSSRPVIDAALTACHNDSDTLAAAEKTKSHYLSLMGCVAAERRKEHTDEAAERRWHVNVKANAALQALGDILKCPQEMARLALYQLDAEYKRDGIRGAEVAGKISLERRDAILAKIPIASRAQYQMHMHNGRIAAMNISDPVLNTPMREASQDQREASQDPREASQGRREASQDPREASQGEAEEL